MPAGPRDPSVSAVMVTKNPDIETMAWTLDRVSEQDHPPMETVIVDSSSPPIEADASNMDVRTIYRPDAGIGEARRIGVQAANGEYVLHLDEDAVLLDDSYISTALERLQQPDVAAAGGVVYPLRENPSGKAIAVLDRLNPTTLGTHNIVHPVAYCQGGMCHTVSHRGEDISVRRRVSQFGKTERMSDQGILKDLPTTRQQLFQQIVVGSISGAVSGVLAGYVRDTLSMVRKEVQEDLSSPNA